jgi:hypothetical protein
MHKNTLPTEKILAQIKQRFYDSILSEKRFYQDRRMLLYTVTWPATWLDKRGLPITSQAYRELLTERLDDIAKHGDPKRYQAYFPRYLLKTIQDWFAHHGEDLYEELKHVRNQLCEIEALIRAQPTQSADDVVTPMAQAHAVLASQNHRKKRADAKQLNLL